MIDLITIWYLLTVALTLTIFITLARIIITPVWLLAQRHKEDLALETPVLRRRRLEATIHNLYLTSIS